MKNNILYLIMLSPLLLISQQMVISSIDKNLNTSFSTITDTINNSMYYTDINGKIDKELIKENLKINCPGFESYTITKNDILKDTIYLKQETIVLKEVLLDANKNVEIGNIQNFKHKTDYNISSLPPHMFIGVRFEVDIINNIKRVGFHSAKKSNKNQVLRVRVFKETDSGLKEIIIGNIISKPITIGVNSIPVNIKLDKGYYYVCLEKTNKEVDYLLSIGKSKSTKKHKTESFIINSLNKQTFPMKMKSEKYNIELMISITLN